MRNTIALHIRLLTLVSVAVVTVAGCGETEVDEGRSGSGAGGTGSGGTIGVDPIVCTDVDCNDLNECTIDACAPEDGTCGHLPANDNTACTFAPGVAGLCRTGVCEDAMLCVNVDCDDFNACTIDACDPASGFCSNPSEGDAKPCDFGGDPGICQSGVCEDAMLCAGVNCDDGEQCTDDSCDRASGACGHRPVVDDTACIFAPGVAGSCSAGVCEDAMLCAGIICADDNECTSDSCDPEDGMCTFTMITNGSTCDFAPGIGGTCTAGICADGMLCAATDCDDSEECTEDACDPSDGACIHTPVADGQLCDSAARVCRSGICAYRGWGSPELLETNNSYHAYNSRIAVSPGGDAIAVWGQDDGVRRNIWASHYTKTGGWEAPELIETYDGGDAYISGVAIDPSGNAIAVWLQMHEVGRAASIWSNRFTPTGGWETPQPLENSPEPASRPEIAFDSVGNGISVWRQRDNFKESIWANHFTLGGGWGTALPIESDHNGDANELGLAVNQNGDAIAVWSQWDGTHVYSNIWANHYTKASGWGTPQVIETNDTDRKGGPKVGLDTNGNAIAVWHVLDANSRFSVWANRYTPTGGWETEQPLEAESQNAVGPQIAIGPAGTAVVAWRQYTTRYQVLWGTSYSSTNGWERAGPVLGWGYIGDAGVPAIAIDSSGNSFIVFTQMSSGRGTILAVRRTSADSWWPTAVQIEYPGTDNAGEPQIGVDTGGNAIVVWQQNDDDRNRQSIWTNRFQ